MQRIANKSYIFAKIHGIHSRFHSGESLFQLLKAHTPQRSLEALGLPPEYLESLRDHKREYVLHSHILSVMKNLLPAPKQTNRFFRTLMSEYEIRNLGKWLKTRKERGSSPDFYSIPSRLGYFRETLLKKKPDPQELSIPAEYKQLVDNFLETEDALRLDRELGFLYSQSLAESAQALPGREKSAICPLVFTHLDLKNTIAMLRGTLLYNQSPEDTAANLYWKNASERKEMQQICRAGEYEDISQLFPGKYRNRIRQIVENKNNLRTAEFDQEVSFRELVQAEEAASILFFTTVHRSFYQNPGTHGPLFCFYFLLKREIMNILLLYNSLRFETNLETFKNELLY